MRTRIAADFSKAHDVAPERIISQQCLRTLNDLLNALVLLEPERSHLLAMLRATAGHIAMHLEESPGKIGISRLLDVKPGLQSYLRGRGFKRTSIRSYTNYLRILLQKAKELGWVGVPPEVADAWQEIERAAFKGAGCRGIVRYAVRKGKLPLDFTESDLTEWTEAALRDGRTSTYLTAVKRRFRMCILRAGLSSHLPNLQPPASSKRYGIPIPQFPEELRTQSEDLIRWKMARFSPGRPIRAKHRPVTAKNLRGLISELYGFLVGIKGKSITTLEELFSREGVSEYLEWAVNERSRSSSSLSIVLGTIYALRTYPALAGRDFSWLPVLARQLPRDFEIQRMEKKDRKWLSYDLLVEIPGQIRRDIKRPADLDEKSKASMVCDALMIQWMTILPWRQRNIRECKLMPFSDGGNLAKEGIPPHSTMAIREWVRETLKANGDEKFWQFFFRPEETKTGHIVRGILPRQLVGPLEEYLDHYRPVLVKGDSCKTLFLTRHGCSFRAEKVREVVGDLTFRYCGRRVNPHLFRDIVADKWLDEHPEDYLTLSKILWHRNINTTIGIYGRTFDESHGARRMEEWLETRKGPLSEKVPRTEAGQQG